MSHAADLYIRRNWETSIPDVLTSAGFQVVTKGREFPNGGLVRVHTCTVEGAVVTFSEGTVVQDADHFFVLALCRPKHSSSLQRAYDALIKRGALDLDTYKRKTGGS